MPISFPTALPPSSLDRPSGPPPSDAKPKSGKTAEAAFLDFAKKTPAEHIRDAMLKKLGLTQEEFDKMDPEAQRAVTEKINEEIKKQVQASGAKRTGMITDITI